MHFAEFLSLARSSVVPTSQADSAAACVSLAPSTDLLDGVQFPAVLRSHGKVNKNMEKQPKAPSREAGIISGCQFGFTGGLGVPSCGRALLSQASY